MIRTNRKYPLFHVRYRISPPPTCYLFVYLLIYERTLIESDMNSGGDGMGREEMDQNYFNEPTMNQEPNHRTTIVYNLQ